VREKYSFAPLGLVSLLLVPTAYAVGCILSPLRDYCKFPQHRLLTWECMQDSSY